METPILWKPSETWIQHTNLTAYAGWLRQRGYSFDTYEDLWRWSTADLAAFWQSIMDFFEVCYTGEATEVLSGAMPDCVWFDGISLSYAEHIFRNATADRPALLCVNEKGDTRAVSWQVLHEQTARLNKWLKDHGLQKGDRVAAVLPNTAEATVSFLATNACGAIWSCCSPDFGTASIVDRFAQIAPRVLILTESYSYNGKRFDCLQTARHLKQQLPSVEQVIIIASERHADFVWWADVMESHPEAVLGFERVPFSHPIWILFSSGTTGLPKAITHSTGGILLEQLKYGTFHNDVKPGERFLWYTTTGWMMWNYLHGMLLCGATIVLYDGSPAFPDLLTIWRHTASLKLHHLGTSAGFLLANRKAGITCSPLDLAQLRSLSSTGSTLPPEGFDWVYEHVKKDVWLVSMSGGTDVCSAFIGGNPWAPVRKGEIQCRALGCKLEAWDENGTAKTGEVGEMVITQPMPSMPVYFWDDPGQRRYRESYFDTYPGVWRHGDWIMITSGGGIVVYGRSDATLNRGGVRMGTSEVYRAVEQVPDVLDSLIVCIEKPNGDFYMPLFVVLRPGHELTDTLRQLIVQTLRTQCSPRHVPDAIIAVPEIPYTLSGKKTELPVKKILSGKSVATSLQPGSLRNADALQFFRELYYQTQTP
jgi:acetoacetyl-CoA synthetase